jgi:hypothetical protein
MGWTVGSARYFKNGKVDRKAECDALCTDTVFRVEKSAMVGAVYYAAIRRIGKYVDGELEMIPTEKQDVSAVVILTSTGKEAYGYFTGYTFGYKDMSEDMHPYYYDCPISILNLLTETESENAKEWRRRCKERHEEKKKAKKNPDSLENLPVGSIIECNGERLKKMLPAYQFKRNWWLCIGKRGYMSPSYIKSTGYTVISRG